jgi:phosphoribosylglycinamide formyltransferase-1
MVNRKKTVSFLASGRGSNFTAVAENILAGKIKAEAGILISDRSDARAIQTAEGFGMKAFYVNPKEFPSKTEFEGEMVSLMKKYNTDLVVAAGYMRILSPYFVNEFRGRIINIHPALLPSFPGVHSQKQAFDYGVKISGCTAHFIDEGTDTGPIIIQAAVHVLDSDTEESLSSKILHEEHIILSEAVSLFCEDRLIIEGRKVRIVK